MEGSRDYMLTFVQKEKTVAFEDKIHAIFLFLSILELTQQKFMKMMVGEGRNNFIVEWNDNREADLADAGLTEEEISASRFED
jgi:segregation and condensation protein A